MPAMAKKRKNKLNKFNHNTDKNAQKNLKKEKKFDHLNRIKKGIAAINTNADKKSNPIRETLDIFQTFTQKIALFALKQKAWIKTQTKTIDAAFKSQLIPQIKTVAKVIDAKINVLKKIKHNFKQNGITSTNSIAELNKDRFEMSFIQPVSQSSPKVIDNLKIFTNAKIVSEIKYSVRPFCPLPKLMSLNVKPTARLEKTLNDLLQKLFEENARKSKYIFDSFSSNHPITESLTDMWSTTNNSTPLQQNLHSFSMAYKKPSYPSNDVEHQKFQTVDVLLKNDTYEEHQFESNNESYETFMTNSYSMTDIKIKESSTNSSTSTKSTNENLYKHNTIVQKKHQDFNAFNEFLLNNKFDIKDYTLIASNFLDEDIVKQYKKKFSF
jgi:hypothetical protein